MAELCMQLFHIGLTEHKQRETEVNSFFSGQDKTKSYFRLKASQILANFEQQHEEVSLCFRKPFTGQCNNLVYLLLIISIKIFHVFTPFQRIEELQQLLDVDIRQDKITHCNEEINQLSKSLMSLEFQLVSQMEVIM